MIFASCLATLEQLFDPRFRRVFFKGVGLTAILMLAFYTSVFFSTGFALPETIVVPLFGEVGFPKFLLSLVTTSLMIVLSTFAMIPITVVIIGFFLDDIADAVEARYYSHLQPAPHISFSDTILEILRFIFVLCVANLIAFILYFIPPFGLFVFYGLNGFLFGREYFRMIAVRRLGRPEASQMFRRHFLTIWAAGALMVIPLTIPILNLVIPILGAATFTHLYHRIAKTA